MLSPSQVLEVCFISLFPFAAAVAGCLSVCLLLQFLEGDMLVGCGDGEIHRFNLDQGRFRTPITLPSTSSSRG